MYLYKEGRIYPVFRSSSFYETLGCFEEYTGEISRETAFQGIHREDLPEVKEKVNRLLRKGTALSHTCRIFNDNQGRYRWVHIDGSAEHGEDGSVLFYAVYRDVSEQIQLKEELVRSNEQMQDIINLIPGGVAIYKVSDFFETVYFSDGVSELSGYSALEYRELIKRDAVEMTCREDREMIISKAGEVVQTKGTSEFEFRKKHRNGQIVWVHVQMKWIGEEDGCPLVLCVFHNITDLKEAQLEKEHLINSIPGGIASYRVEGERFIPEFYSDGVMMISGHTRMEFEAMVRRNAFDVIYEPDRKRVLEAAKTALISGEVLDVSYRMYHKDGNLIWIHLNGRRMGPLAEKMRFYAVFTGMSAEARLFQEIANETADGIYVIDRSNFELLYANESLNLFMEKKKCTGQKCFKVLHGKDSPCEYCNIIQYEPGSEEHEIKIPGSDRVYSARCHKTVWNGIPAYVQYVKDITQTVREQERIRNQYKDLLLKHYRTPGPDALVVGHCNVTKSRILDILDYTGSDLMETFSDDRECFFMGLSSLVTDEKERKTFRETFLNEPSLKAFERGDLERKLECFVRLPKDQRGRYVQFNMNMVAAPDSGDITGILTVTDITERKISDLILRQLSVTGVDVDLTSDRYKLLSCSENAFCVPPHRGRHSEWTAYMLRSRVVPRDREQYKNGLEPEKMMSRLQKDGPYTFAFCISDDKGDIRTKNMTVSAVDLRLGRVCLSRSDITDSIREQQGLLHMIAYTFELAAFINLSSRSLTLYTRESVLDNLQPHYVENYDRAILKFVEHHGTSEHKEEARTQFRIETMTERLREKPNGYDFLFSYEGDNGERFKQINVLWGDVNHRTLCLVRADVTEMLTAERQAKKRLEHALASAEEANKAKSDFLSAMSHDIRTPMNAIMGMTTLASAYLGDDERVAGYLDKIEVSSRHLLSLINDILDMSKIERAQISLNLLKVSLPDLIDQLTVMILSQAEEAGVSLNISTEGIVHEDFYGDPLRINQILINLLSNAVKFTGRGGAADFLAEEIKPERDAGRVRYRFTASDTGIGMPEDFLSQVFEPFSRSENAARIEGTGLGLSITKGLVDLMEGQISAESRIHERSAFTVELEFDRAESENGLSRGNMGQGFCLSAAEKALAGRCFLVAEDNTINAEILCELLKLCGAETLLAADGMQAVQIFRDAKPNVFDAILMDIQMPEMNGYDAARAVRSMDRADAEEIPIVAMTANAFAEDVERSREAGMNAHVAKPIDLEVLMDTLWKVMKAPNLGET